MLELKDISVTFNKHTPDERIALNDVSLKLEENDFVTVIGGNGAGKSTLLNVVAGMIFPDKGNVIIGGTDVTGQSDFRRAKRVARVFQDPMKGTAANMNVSENLALAFTRGKSRGLRWNVTKSDEELFRSKLAELELGLESRLNAKVSLLSGGQRQALTLLMAVLEKPDVLLLDEHTAALDPSTAKRVLEITEKVTKEQTTVMVTHNMADAVKYGNHLIMMHEGRIIFSAKGEEKRSLTVQALLEKFAALKETNDRIMLV